MKDDKMEAGYDPFENCEYDVRGEIITLTPEEQALLRALYARAIDTVKPMVKEHRDEIFPHMPEHITQCLYIIRYMIYEIIASLSNNPVCKIQLVALENCSVFALSLLGLLSDDYRRIYTGDVDNSRLSKRFEKMKQTGIAPSAPLVGLATKLLENCYDEGDDPSVDGDGKKKLQ